VKDLIAALVFLVLLISLVISWGLDKKD